MASLPTIQISNLSKVYALKTAAPADNLRELLTLRFKQLFLKNSPQPELTARFPALRTINLSIASGETVGIIGKNGAGKSTLLRILSRVTEPTEGSVQLIGKVAALLEVGLGFHPDLTGRDNVYLGGALLGLRRKEIKQRFQEICDFAEIGNFIDVPVKKYSSGMYVRLAFAIAACLEADILLIDEVLAVGDAAFQKKCLNKLVEINRRGTTILMVSHNLTAVERLCQRCLVLQAGSVAFEGAPVDAIAFYQRQSLASNVRSFYLCPPAAPVRERPAYIQAARICNLAGEPQEQIPTGEGCQLQLEIVKNDRLLRPQCTLYLRNLEGQIIARLAPQEVDLSATTEASQFQLVCTLPRLNLVPNRYTLDLHLYVEAKTIEYLEGALNMEITESVHLPLPSLPAAYRGFVLLDQSWSLNA